MRQDYPYTHAGNSGLLLDHAQVPLSGQHEEEGFR